MELLRRSFHSLCDIHGIEVIDEMNGVPLLLVVQYAQCGATFSKDGIDDSTGHIEDSKCYQLTIVNLPLINVRKWRYASISFPIAGGGYQPNIYVNIIFYM